MDCRRRGGCVSGHVPVDWEPVVVLGLAAVGSVADIAHSERPVEIVEELVADIEHFLELEIGLAAAGIGPAAVEIDPAAAVEIGPAAAVEIGPVAAVEIGPAAADIVSEKVNRLN